jgi:hypothetical protein
MDDKFFQGEHEGIHLTGGSRKVVIVVDPRKSRDKAFAELPLSPVPSAPNEGATPWRRVSLHKDACAEASAVALPYLLDASASTPTAARAADVEVPRELQASLAVVPGQPRDQALRGLVDGLVCCFISTLNSGTQALVAGNIARRRVGITKLSNRG